ISLLLSTEVDLDEDLTKLGRRQTRANDRAVEGGAHLPDAPAPRRRPGDQGHLVLKQTQRTRNRRVSQRKEARVQAWQLCCHASTYSYEHSDVQKQNNAAPDGSTSHPAHRRVSSAAAPGDTRIRCRLRPYRLQPRRASRGRRGCAG